MTIRMVLAIAAVALLAAPSLGAPRNSYKPESFVVTIGGTKARAVSARTLDSDKPGLYSVRNLFDGDRSTAWCAVIEEKEIGQILPGEGQLRIIFEKPVYVNSVRIKNGKQKSRKVYENSRRVKSLYIEKEIMGGPSFPFGKVAVIADSMDEQSISMTEGWTQAINMVRTREILIGISDIYGEAGSEGPCVSEMFIETSDSSEYVAGMGWPALKKKIDENKVVLRDGWDWAGMDDNHYSLFNDLLLFTLTGNSEAYTYFDTYKPEGAGSSEGMTFVFRPAVRETLGIGP